MLRIIRVRNFLIVIFQHFIDLHKICRSDDVFDALADRSALAHEHGEQFFIFLERGEHVLHRILPAEIFIVGDAALFS